MPELKSPDGSSPLSQKRVLSNSSSIPKIESLDRVEREMPPQLTRVRQPMKVDLNQKANLINPEEKNSSAKIVIWVVIVIVLAIASYLGLKSFLNGPTKTTDNTTTTNYVTPVVDYVSTIVQSSKLPDSQAVLKQSFVMYNNGSQKVGAASSGTFDLSNVSVQQYDTFTRLSLEVGKIDGDGSMPLVNTTYNKTTNEITIDLVKTTTTLDIPFDREIVIGTDTVDSLIRINTDNSGSEQFVIKLSQPTVYLLQASSSSDSPTIYLDIKEVSNVATPTPSTAVTIVPSLTPSITTSITGDVLDNVYSKDAQVLHNGISSNTASFNRFTYGDGAVEFTYKAEINAGTNGKMPNVSAKLVGSVLTVEVTNLLSRNATATLTPNSTKDVQKIDIVSSGNTRTYTFTLGSSKEYKISYKFDDTTDKQFANALWIQIKH